MAYLNPCPVPLPLAGCRAHPTNKDPLQGTMASGPPPLRPRFDRFECKYLITEAQAHAVRRYLAPYVEPDPHAAGRPDHRYPIASLYLDTPDLRLHRETVEGLRNRYKLRVRSYSDDANTPVFLEIKRRNNQVTQKQRCAARRSDVLGLLTTGERNGKHMPPADRKVFDEFAQRLQHIGARPIVVVRYEREALCGIFDPHARVTFDRQIRARSVDGPRLRVQDSFWELVEGRRVVLELKFNGQCPFWMQNAIHRLGLVRTSFSKYCHAVLTARRAGPLLADA
jgi:hypothetical protein